MLASSFEYIFFALSTFLVSMPFKMRPAILVVKFLITQIGSRCSENAWIVHAELLNAIKVLKTFLALFIFIFS